MLRDIVLIIAGLIVLLVCACWALTGTHAPLLINSAIVVVLSCVLSGLGGGVSAWILGWTEVPGRKFWFALLLVWAATPLMVQISAWDALWGRLSWLSTATTVNYRRWIDGFPAVILIHALANLPWVALVVLAAKQSTSSEPEQMAATQAGAFAVFTRITLPRHLAIFLTATLLVGLRVFEQFEVTDVYQIRTWAEVWYMGFSLGQFDSLESFWSLDWFSQWSGQAAGIYPVPPPVDAGASLPGASHSVASQPSASSAFDWGSIVPLLGLLLAIFLICVGTLQRWFFGQDLSEHYSSKRVKFATQAWLNALLGVCLLLPQLLIWFNLLARAGVRVTRVDGQYVSQWSVANLGKMLLFCANDYQAAAIWSLTIGVSGAIAIWVMALGLGWFAHNVRVAFVWRGIVLILTVVSLATPAPLLSLFWYRLLFLSSWDGLSTLAATSILGPVLAITSKYVGWGILFYTVHFAKQPLALREQMQVDGMGAWQQFWHLGIRQHRALHFGVLLFLILIAAGDLTVSFAVLPPGIDTLPRRILGDLHAGAGDQVAGACLLQMIGIAIAVGLFVPSTGNSDPS